MKFQIKYKCRMCNEEIVIRNVYEMSEDEASKLINKAIIHDDVIGARFGLATKYIHNCSDGSIGIADFQGIKNLNPLSIFPPIAIKNKKPWYKRIFRDS